MPITINERLHLSELVPADEAAAVEYLSDNGIYERTLRIPFPYTAAAFHEWFNIVTKAKEQQGHPVHWAIRNRDGHMIGGCGFHDLEIGKAHKGEIGYWLAKPYWGQGIMTDVVRRLCDFGFAELGLAKIIAHVFADNTASARVLEKCGFVQEGYLRKHYLKNGRFIDARLFALIKE